MNGLRFAHPWFLLLLALPLILAWLRRRSPALSPLPFPGLAAAAALKPSYRLAAARHVWVLGSASLGFLVLALARPQKGLVFTRSHAEGIALEMVVDVSGSMRALDFQIHGRREDRLSVVKTVFQTFVLGGEGLKGRPNDLVGVVAFGGYPTSFCPLTLDHKALAEVLGTLKIPDEIFDARGQLLNREEYQTAIGDGLALGAARLRDAKAKSKVIILITDGESNAGRLSPDEGARLAKALDIKIYSIGVGTRGTAPFPTRDFLGRVVLQDMQVSIDEETLTRLAESTGGRYFRALDTEGLKSIYKEIDGLEKSEAESLRFTEYRELYLAFLAAGLLLLLLDWALGLTWLRTAP